MTMLSVEAARAAGVFAMPEPRVLAMLEQCAKRIESVASVEDAASAASMAEAVAAMTQKMKLADRVKFYAYRIALDAELKLGQMTSLIPKTRGPNATMPAGGRGSKPSKERTLRELGLAGPRCREAEKIAGMPKATVDAAFERSKTKTMNSVKVELGMRPSNSETRIRASKFEDDVNFLAGEAVDLLKRAVEQDRTPHAGTVDELARRLAHLRMNRQRYRAE